MGDEILPPLEPTPLGDFMRERSKASALVHRNPDRIDPYWFKPHHASAVVNENLLPTKLCSICKSIRFLPPNMLPRSEILLAVRCFPDDETFVFVRRLFYVHHPSLDSLYNSFQSGCHSCLLIWNTAFADRDVSTADLGLLSPVILTMSLTMKETAWSSDWFPGNGNYVGVYHLNTRHAFASLRMMQLSNPMSRVLQRVATSPLHAGHNLRLAKMWQANCWINHPECFQAAIPPMPTRLLDVGPADGSQLPRICTPRVPARYLALSHCWGSAELPRTTTTNYVERSRAISMESLSQTMRDAVLVTREFGIKYIWIDSLCIIQDSLEDWEKESAKMCDVYQNALFTIAASQARHGGDGLFNGTNPLLYTPCLLPQYEFLTDGGNKFHIHLIPDQKPNDRGPEKNTLTGPLYDRAWVLQEEKLSHATLAFTEGGMTWQCAYSTLTSRDPEGIDDHIRNEYLRDAINFKLTFSRDPEVLQQEIEAHNAEKSAFTFTSKRDQIYENWMEILEQYLLRKITFPSDRLPALSGLAAATCKVLSTSFSQEIYVAGIWIRDLERQLCWSSSMPHLRSDKHRDMYRHWELRKTPQRRIRTPELFLAPSWSWASMHETPVGWANHYFQQWDGGWVKWTHTACDPSGQNPFGNVKWACVYLECILFSVMVWGSYDFLWDIPTEDIAPEEDGPALRIGKLILDDERDRPPKGVVNLIPILSSKTGDAMLRGGELGEDFRWKITCLAVEATGLAPAEFRRIGLALVSDLDYFHDIDKRTIVLV